MTPPLRALRGVGTHQNLVDMSRAERHRLLVQLQLEERLGLLFSDYRRNSGAVMYFTVAIVLRDVIAGLLIGVQEGAGVSIGSTASRALNCALFGTYACFALLLLALRPPALVWMFLLAYTAAVLEAVAAGCIALVSFSPSWEGAQNAMFYLQVALLALMTVATWLCLGVMFCALGRRWQQDRVMLRSEDEEGALILRKESMLRHSFRESLRASRTREAEDEEARAAREAQEREAECLQGLEQAVEKGRAQALELRRKLEAGEELGEGDFQAAAPSSAGRIPAGQSILGRQASLPGAVGPQGREPEAASLQEPEEGDADAVQPVEAGPPPQRSASSVSSASSAPSAARLGGGSRRRSMEQLLHLNNAPPQQQFQRSRFMPPSPAAAPDTPPTPGTPVTPSTVLVEQDLDV